jgi:hypothetical protein
MYKVTNPNTGKTYTYGPAKREQAEALAKKLGVEAIHVKPPQRQATSKRCVCGRPEDSHESYDCVKDWQKTGGW